MSTVETDIPVAVNLIATGIMNSQVKIDIIFDSKMDEKVIAEIKQLSLTKDNITLKDDLRILFGIQRKLNITFIRLCRIINHLHISTDISSNEYSKLCDTMIYAICNHKGLYISKCGKVCFCVNCKRWADVIY